MSWNTVHEKVIVFATMTIVITFITGIMFWKQVESRTGEKTWTPSINKERSFTSIIHGVSNLKIQEIG